MFGYVSKHVVYHINQNCTIRKDILLEVTKYTHKLANIHICGGMEGSPLLSPWFPTEVTISSV